MDVENLNRRFRYLKRELTQFSSQVNDLLADSSCTVTNLKDHLHDMQITYQRWQDVKLEMVTLVDDVDTSPETRNVYLEAIGRLKDHLAIIEDKAVSSHNAPTRSTHVLPSLKLPTFDGKYSEFQNFYGTFIQLIDNEPSFTTITKFNYLLSCLAGPALEMVRAFKVTEENYTPALNMIKERYDNPYLLVNETIVDLFEMPVMAKPNARQLRSLIDNTVAMSKSLQTSVRPEDLNDAILVHLLMSKVDEKSQLEWKKVKDKKSLPKLTDCVAVLERQCDLYESINNHRNVKDQVPHHRRSVVMKVEERRCHVCSSGKHIAYQCKKLLDLAIPDRIELIKNLKLCVNCLSNAHSKQKCTSRSRCKHCSSLHNSLLHLEANRNGVEAVNAHTETVLSCFNQGMNSSLLPTATVLVRSSSGSYLKGTALLDSCSQINIISEDFAQRLRLNKTNAITTVDNIDSSSKLRHQVRTEVKNRTGNFVQSITCCVSKKISHQPHSVIHISKWRIPRNISLADEQFHVPKVIDMLLGTDVFYNSLSVGQIKMGDNLPSLQKTVFGWVAVGKYIENQTSKVKSTFALFNTKQTIDRHLERLWELDNTTTLQSQLSTEHQLCQTIFDKTVQQNDEGRIVVKLPFNTPPDDIGETYNIAVRRMKAMEVKLNKNADLKRQYSEFMEEYIQLGHMSVVQDHDLRQPNYYIPHHFVLKPASSTTKLRVVFDASCKSSSGVSLNDRLLAGPTIQRDLSSILLNFRLHQYAMTADIVKMYRQVLITSDDRRYQYIVWRSSPDQHFRTYSLNTVTYGLASAPYLAIRSLHYLADKFESQFPIAAKIIKTAFYVDDMLCGADTMKELLQIKSEVTELLRCGKFELSKWHSNIPEIRDDNQQKHLNLDDDTTISALGISWDQEVDHLTLSFHPKRPYDGKPTKRKILALASSLFDPIGLVSPIIIRAKIILQELWLLRLDWDESLPQSLHSAWNEFYSDLEVITNIRVSRFCLQSNYTEIELHGFCDASLRAFGACFYIRTVNNHGDVSSQLFNSKSRVSPTKRKSLPKLELCAAHLLANLYNKVKPILSIKTVYLWTDSSLVLYWLKQHSSSLSVFVGNRVADIQELTKGCVWRHVPSEENPADLISRGISISYLNASIWFTGPSYLLNHQSRWPNVTHAPLDTDIIDKEQRKVVFLKVVSENYLLVNLQRFSKYITILHVVGWLLYWKSRFRMRCEQPLHLTPELLDASFWCIIWNYQQQQFITEIRSVKEGLPQTGSIKYLTPFLESSAGFEILKVGGRLKFATISSEQRHPAILHDCHFIQCYVQYLHVKNFHAGVKALLTLIRQRIWLINGRKIARRIVNSCIHCVKYKPRLENQIMGNLPAERVNPTRPFFNVGIDFCGPVMIYVRLRGHRPTKAYVAVFICMSTKAVHIELVSSLSTDAFIAALKRMIARRGIPKQIFCDNATNFVGANNRLKELKTFLFNENNQSIITRFCANEMTSFRFIPPRAPHFGGLWEAAIKSAKGHLNRTCVNRRLTMEELTTALAEIEAILNSRPLVAESSDPNDYNAITPGHFLIGNALTSLPHIYGVSKDRSLHQKWKEIENIKEEFWKRWSRDYLIELQLKTKWTTKVHNLSIGDLVLLKEDNLPPLHWPRGRITELVYGDDGAVRVVVIRTVRGTIKRPVNRVARLPVETNVSTGAEC